MRKLPECDRCQMNARSQYLVCAIHPAGYLGEACPDFARIPGLKEEIWSPVGASYYGGELVLEVGHLSRCDGLRPVVDHREWLVEHHPLFTGRCPQCGSEFQEDPAVHWDCGACGWVDDSV